jgi:UDP-glucose 4-epimerase
MTEEHPYNNRTFYGATKIAGEQMCRAFYHRYGLPYVGLRYMNVYGPRQDDRGVYTSVIMKVLDRLDQGLPPIVFGDGSQCYDFVHVTDVARANVCALKSDATDEFLNVGAGIKTSVKELVDLMLRMTGSNLEIEYRPQHAEQSLVTHRVGSTEKARRIIGFEARIPLEKGLRSVIEWRRANEVGG